MAFKLSSCRAQTSLSLHSPQRQISYGNENLYIGGDGGQVHRRIGTPERDRYEAEQDAELHAYHVGEAIKQARLSQNLTQEQLGEKVGVQKAQISRLEHGKSISLASMTSMTRVFRAMGIPLTLEVGNIGRVALW